MSMGSDWHVSGHGNVYLVNSFWNCGGNHGVNKCTKPKNPNKIAESKRNWKRIRRSSLMGLVVQVLADLEVVLTVVAVVILREGSLGMVSKSTTMCGICFATKGVDRTLLTLLDFMLNSLPILQLILVLYIILIHSTKKSPKNSAKLLSLLCHPCIHLLLVLQLVATWLPLSSPNGWLSVINMRVMGKILRWLPSSMISKMFQTRMVGLLPTYPFFLGLSQFLMFSLCGA